MKVYRRIATPLIVAASCLMLASCAAENRPETATPLFREWLDTEGLPHSLHDGASAATVLLFIATECPISNGYTPEIRRVVDAYGPRDVAFYAIHADSNVTADAARRHASEFGLPFPVLLDPAQTLTRQVGATTTPEAAVLDENGGVVYLGRIDNLHYGFGKRRHAATTHELRDALDAVLTGRPVTPASEPAVGCEIAPPKDSNRAVFEE